MYWVMVLARWFLLCLFTCCVINSVMTILRAFEGYTANWFLWVFGNVNSKKTMKSKNYQWEIVEVSGRCVLVVSRFQDFLGVL